MANTVIQLKKSVVSGNVPSLLHDGELALNAADGILFYKDNFGTIRSISTAPSTNSFSTINIGSTLLISTTPNDILSIRGGNGITTSGYSSNDTIIISSIDGSTSQKGIVQLYDGVDSTSTSLAATSNSVNSAYNLANTAYNLVMNSSGSSTINLQYQEFVANGNQSIFTVSGGYEVGKITVFLNGILLNSSDYTANDGALINLSIPASLGDNIVIEKWSNTTVSANTYNLDHGQLTSNSVTTTTNTANQVLDIFSTSIYRSVKYQIQVTSSTDYQVSEVSLIHDGANSYLTEYGLITTNSTLMNYDTDISGGSVRLLMSPINNINTINLIKTSIVV